MNTREKSLKETLNLEYLFVTVKRSWYVFALCIFLGFVFAYIRNKTELPVYEVGASILIHENKPQYNRASSQLFEGFGLFNTENTFKNELQVLKSSPLLTTAISNLDVQITYYCETWYNKQELYKTSPFVVIINQSHPQTLDVEFKVEIIDDNKFNIEAKSDMALVYSYEAGNTIQTVDNFKMKGIYNFKDNIISEYYDFKLILNKNFNADDYKSNDFSFVINNPNSMVKMYRNMITVEPFDMESSVALIRAKTTVPLKAIDVIKSIGDVYLANDLEAKIHASIKTIEYIDNQLNIISDSLHTAELNLQKFRTSNQVMDITIKSGRVYDQLQQLEHDKGEMTIKYKYYLYINDYFEKNREISDLIAPSSIGIEDPLINNLIQELTTLNAEKASLIENKQEKSPYLKKINIQIDNLINTISENIKYIISTTEMALKDFDTRINGLNSEVNKLPKTERELVGYERKFNLNDAIYTYLLEKRAEAQIAKASYMPNAQIIEPSSIVSNGPISPRKKLNYMIGILLGAFLPFVFIRLKDVFQNRITENTEIESLTNLPLLGKVYKNNKKTDLVVNNFPKSHVTESFRKIRTSLNYFLEQNDKAVLVITSSFAQEGKSFISVNLAISLASVNKKTIILGFDLRKPKIFERLNICNEQGISTFLSNQASFEDILQHTNVANLDIITSGPVPPNPSELISSAKTSELINHVKSIYDFIIMDTPPVGIISDTYLLMDKADLNIYVVRQDQTPKREFLRSISDLQEKNFRKLCLVVNDTTLLKGSKYGYGYYDETEKTK
jgi:tyrosine-protein kinase Etk/Wzc